MKMGKYFRKQFQVSMFGLEHEVPSDFYLSCWQKNRAVLPLLCLRAVIFLGCVATIIASFTLTAMSVNFGYWFIFMTHWGLVMNAIASGFGFAVSLRAYLKGPLEASLEVPWYVKAYWISYNIAVVIAFFITVYYYAFLLAEIPEDEMLDPVLDAFIHGVNSILMFSLMITSRHPARILHFIYPVAFGIVYLIFTVIYYFAGGVDMFGNPYIYPTLDWSDPGMTTVMVVITAVMIIIFHELMVGLIALRDWLARRCGRMSSNSMDISNPNIAYS